MVVADDFLQDWSCMGVEIALWGTWGVLAVSGSGNETAVAGSESAVTGSETGMF